MIKSTISKLKALRDVNPAGLADGDALVWSAADSKFEPGAGGGGGASPTEIVQLTTSAAVLGGSKTALSWGYDLADGHWDTVTIYKTDGTTPASVTWLDVSGDDPIISGAGLYLVETAISFGTSDATSTAVQITTSLGTVNTSGLGVIKPGTGYSWSLSGPFMAQAGDVPCFPQVTASAIDGGNLGSGAADWYATMWITKL